MLSRHAALFQFVIAVSFLCGLDARAQAEVYRCGNTYSQEPCKGGRQVDTSPPVASIGGSGSPSTQTVYLCRNKAGDGFFWTKQHCHEANAWVERTESVPKNMSWEDQLAMARAQRDAAAALTSPPPRNLTQQNIQAKAASNKLACEALDQRVKDLDSMGRAGSRHYDLDWIRTQRKIARDEQFRLRC